MTKPKAKPAYEAKEDYSIPFGDAAKFVDKDCKLTIVDGNGKPLDITAVDYHMGGGGVVVTVKQKRAQRAPRELVRRWQVQYGQWKGEAGYVVVDSTQPDHLGKSRIVRYSTDSKSDAMRKADELNAAEENSNG